MKIEASRVVIKENVSPFSTIGMIKVILTLHPRLIMTILDPQPIGLVSNMVILNLGWRVRITVIIPPEEKGLLHSKKIAFWAYEVQYFRSRYNT